MQTFPDNYIFCGSKESVRKQIGMAVPPKGVGVIFKAILKTFAKIEYEFEQPNISPFVQQEHVHLYNEMPFSGYQLRICEEMAEFFK